MPADLSPIDKAKFLAAKRATDFVEDGMKQGLGTGSTAAWMVRCLAERIREEGLRVVGLPTSSRTAQLAAQLGVPLTTLDESPELDLTVDGADEFDPSMRLIKGGGGALLREKIVASASARMIVITDASKRVERLGRFPLPVEVAPFGAQATRRAIAARLHSLGCAGDIALRAGDDGAPFVTDGGHFIFDCSLGSIPDAEALADALVRVPGVMEHGLFLGLATAIIVATDGGVEVIGSPEGT